jgi:hypothetical protein
MADGSRPTIVEADAAAAEAAREARAEVLERAEQDASPPAPVKKHARASRAVKSGRTYHEFTVDVWLTDFNAVEFGVYKHSRNKAKSRQFTSDMDIFAEVKEDGEQTGLIGYREDLWKKKTGMDKRLVFKLFNESLNWRATMDLMLGRSLQLTIGARGLPVTCFSMNVGDHDFMVYLERSANKWPMLPENYSFFILEDGKPAFYRLRRDFIDLGGDYTLYNEKNQKIGRINGRVFSLGGFWKCRILTQHADQKLVMVMQLFCGMLAFGRGCRKHMRALSRDVISGKIPLKLEKQEADLYMNPRRVR